MRNETRFRMVEQMHPKRFEMLLERARVELANRFVAYEHLAKLAMPSAQAQQAGDGEKPPSEN
jgi:hypothetical protein